MEIETRAGKQALAIDQIRLMKQAAFLRPMSGRKRVFILADAEEMSADAANSLLKVLEEPPLFSHIVLVTPSPFLLLPTIVSRCQTLAFSAISNEEIGRILADHDYPEDQARILSLLVDGNLERALGLEWEEVQALKEGSWRLFESLATAASPSPSSTVSGRWPRPRSSSSSRRSWSSAPVHPRRPPPRRRRRAPLPDQPRLEPRLREAAATPVGPRAAALLAAVASTLSDALSRNLNTHRWRRRSIRTLEN